MAYTALYRELRPKVFSDVIGQEHITTTLKNEIRAGRIAHAYLFSGTRGTGKTTCAKILAKALNCLDLQDGEPCNRCENCLRIDSGLSLDVVEQDAATNNKVDDIRDLIDEVQYPPQEGAYKVYILDEAHMLTMGAVNAFLKTLEEPPENVVFILATTDPQKLPITILSRCQRFEFHRIKSKDIEQRLREIVDEKSILADNRSLALIARVSEGAMRDALSVLDQSISMGHGEVQYDTLVNILGLMGRQRIFDLAESILKKDVEKTLLLLDELMDAGKDPYFITRDLLEHFRNMLITKVIRHQPDELVEASEEDVARYQEQSLMIRDQEIIKVIRILQGAEESAKRSSQGRIYLELALIKICNGEMDYGMDALVARMNHMEQQLSEARSQSSRPSPAPKAQRPSPASGPKQQPARTQAPQAPAALEENPQSQLTLQKVRSAWNEVEEALRAKRQMVIRASLFEGQVVDVNHGIITLEFPENYSHNKKRLEKTEFRSLLEDTMSLIFGEPVRLRLKIKSEGAPSQRSIEEAIREQDLTDIDLLS
ncbi:DNA polymerase III subunits gamma and tau [Clostridiaceae bacterium JG1575]|nr:DNA polymerase III subunits gamma and tau [Clostridiaceae bacterium JG1575]